jgi:P22_AR N-terminal domain./ORF6C domain.
MKNETKKIPFNGGELLGVKDDKGEVWLGIKKACLDIGLTENQARSEIKKIQNMLLFRGKCVKFDTVQQEGNAQVNREVMCLHEKFVSMWLAQINLTPNMQKTNPKAVEKLLKYQLEASKVLHSAFYETEEQKQALHSKMGIEGKIDNLGEQVSDMKGSLEMLIDSSTINTHQQQKLYASAKDRINSLLGGAHSKRYKEDSRSYFANLWNDLKKKFECGSYKDLNPIYFNDAKRFVENWEGLSDC